MATFKLKQCELSEAIGFSATALSQYLNSKYPHDPREIEAALERWMSELDTNWTELSRADKRRLAYIIDLLDHADNKTAILRTIGAQPRQITGA